MPTGPGLEVTSGIGTVSGVAAVNALPVTLYGASGDVITDFSGALNVNISGGTISVSISGQSVSANVSGNVVRLAGASGNLISDFSGALNVNVSGGNISAAAGLNSGSQQLISGGQLALSGLIVEISGQFVFTSGGGSPNISGGVTVSGSVILSGPAVPWGSGTTQIVAAGQSGIASAAALFSWDALSGYRPLIAKSGLDNLYALQVYVVSGSAAGTGSPNISGGVTVSGLVGISGGAAGLSGLSTLTSVSGNAILVISGTTIPVTVVSGPWATVGGGQGDAFGNNNPAVTVITYTEAFNGGTWDRIRTLTATSGNSRLGNLAASPPLWKYNNVTAAGVTNIYQSGAVHLHAININDYSSGLSFRVRDSQSGAAGTIVGNIQPFAGGLTVTDIPPASLPYDAVFVTGLVIDTSGTGWDLTVLWRNLTS